MRAPPLQLRSYTRATPGGVVRRIAFDSSHVPQLCADADTWARTQRNYTDAFFLFIETRYHNKPPSYPSPLTRMMYRSLWLAEVLLYEDRITKQTPFSNTMLYAAVQLATFNQNDRCDQRRCMYAHDRTNRLPSQWSALHYFFSHLSDDALYTMYCVASDLAPKLAVLRGFTPVAWAHPPCPPHPMGWKALKKHAWYFIDHKEMRTIADQLALRLDSPTRNMRHALAAGVPKLLHAFNGYGHQPIAACVREMIGEFLTGSKTSLMLPSEKAEARGKRKRGDNEIKGSSDTGQDVYDKMQKLF